MPWIPILRRYFGADQTRLLFISVVGLGLFANALISKGDSATAARVSYARTVEESRVLIKALMKEHDVPGLSLALVDDQTIIWAEGFGHADVKAEVAAGADTRYRFGTASALLTVTAAMQLHGRGKLELKRHVAHYVPEFRMRSHPHYPQATAVSVRSIMTQHSGLPPLLLHRMWSRHAIPKEEILSQLRQQAPQLPPDTIMTLSVPAMALLGLVLERITGRNFEAHMQQALLRPLAMQHSSFAFDAAAPLAQEYKNAKAQTRYYVRDVAAAGLITTANDMAQFLKMVFAGGRNGQQRLLSETGVNAMWRVQNRGIALDLGSEFGYGWAMAAFDIRGAGTVAHVTGDSLFHKSQIVALPQHRLGIVVLANSAESRHAVDRIAQEVLTRALRDKSGIVQPVTQTERRIPLTNLSPAARRTISGQYATWLGWAQVYSKDKDLRISINNKELFLLPYDNGRFAMEYRLFGMIPIRIAALEPLRMSTRQYGKRLLLVSRYRGSDFVFGEKLQPQAMPASWRKRLGSYQIEQQDEVYRMEQLRLIEQDGMLMLQHKIPALAQEVLRMPLQVLSDKQAMISGIGGSGGAIIDVIRDDRGERLSLLGFHARRR